MSLVLLFGTAIGFWLFQQHMFPASDGTLGAVIGFLLGAFLAALFEDYIDQNLN
jgi:membrane associated rhomboid family serine protease